MEAPHRCSTCPAFTEMEGEGGAGTCRANPPSIFPERDFFRGSSRARLFGTYPTIGVFPITHGDDHCMAHPLNRKEFLA